MGTQASAGDWIRPYTEAWNAHDVEAVVGYMTDDVVYADMALGERVEGAAAVRELLAGMATGLSSDYRMELGQVVLTEDAYAVEWTMSGTNDRSDEERGMPNTGQRFSIPGVSVGRLRDGKIAENRDYWNLAGYLMQVGLMPTPEAAAPVTA